MASSSSAQGIPAKKKGKMTSEFMLQESYKRVVSPEGM